MNDLINEGKYLLVETTIAKVLEDIEKELTEDERKTLNCLCHCIIQSEDEDWLDQWFTINLENLSEELNEDTELREHTAEYLFSILQKFVDTHLSWKTTFWELGENGEKIGDSITHEVSTSFLTSIRCSEVDGETTKIQIHFSDQLSDLKYVIPKEKDIVTVH